MENKKLISISDICKKSFEFYKSEFYLILTLSCIPFASFLIISLLTELIGGKIHDNILVFGLGSLAVLFGLFSLVINYWVNLTFFYAIKERGITKDARGLLVFSWNKIIPSSWITFLVAIILIAGFILLVIPGIIFSIWFSLALYVFVFEDIKGMPALYRSKELVKGYFWSMFGRLFLFGIITGLVGSIPVVGNVISIFFVVPFSIVCLYFVYEDLKMIKSN